MVLVLTCPTCGLRGRVRDTAVVTADFQCPECGTPVPVPGTGAPAQPLARLDRRGEGRARGSGFPPRNGAFPGADPADRPGDGVDRSSPGSAHKKPPDVTGAVAPELAAWQARCEAAFADREGELNQREEALAAAEVRLAERELSLAARLERAATADRELRSSREEAAALRSAVAGLRRESARLLAAVHHAQEALRALEDEIARNRGLKEEMARRQEVLTQSEWALERRLAEADELERRVRAELKLQGDRVQPVPQD